MAHGGNQMADAAASGSGKSINRFNVQVARRRLSGPTMAAIQHFKYLYQNPFDTKMV